MTSLKQQKKRWRKTSMMQMKIHGNIESLAIIGRTDSNSWFMHTKVTRSKCENIYNCISGNWYKFFRQNFWCMFALCLCLCPTINFNKTLFKYGVSMTRILHQFVSNQTASTITTAAAAAEEENATIEKGQSEFLTSIINIGANLAYKTPIFYTMFWFRFSVGFFFFSISIFCWYSWNVHVQIFESENSWLAQISGTAKWSYK